MHLPPLTLATLPDLLETLWVNVDTAVSDLTSQRLTPPQKH